MAFTAATSSGIKSGRTSSDVSTPPPRKPSVSAAPTAPVKAEPLSAPAAKPVAAVGFGVVGIEDDQVRIGPLELIGQRRGVEVAQHGPRIVAGAPRKTRLAGDVDEESLG